MAIAAFIAKIGGKVVGAVSGFKKASGNAKRQDTATIEQGQAIVNGLWTRLSGETLGLFQPSRYPNIAAGPLGNRSIDVSVMISSASNTVIEAKGLLVRKESASNPFFTNGASGRIGLMIRVKEAREKSRNESLIEKAAAPLTLHNITSLTKSPTTLLIVGVIILGSLFLFRSRK